MRTHYESARRQTGVTPAELIAPPLPSVVAHAWSDYLELDRARGQGGFYTEMDAWAKRTGRALSRFDVHLLAELERVVQRHRAEIAEKGRTK